MIWKAALSVPPTVSAVIVKGVVPPLCTWRICVGEAGVVTSLTPVMMAPLGQEAMIVNEPHVLTDPPDHPLELEPPAPPVAADPPEPGPPVPPVPP